MMGSLIRFVVKQQNSSTLDHSASAGNGSITNKVIKSFTRIFAPIFYKLFNDFIKQSVVTNDWKIK